MKCVCGYEHRCGVDNNGDWQDNLVGDEKFRVIEGSIFRILNASSFYSEHTDVRLCACPKCGTVRIDE